MSITGWFAFAVDVLLLIGIAKGSASSGGGAYDEYDPNQFTKDELDPSNPNNLMLRNHHDDDVEDFLYSHAIETPDD
jgi:hypothetical protein